MISKVSSSLKSSNENGIGAKPLSSVGLTGAAATGAGAAGAGASEAADGDGVRRSQALQLLDEATAALPWRCRHRRHSSGRARRPTGMTFRTSWVSSSLLERTQSGVVSNTWAKATRSSRPEGASAALDRVNGAKYRVDGFGSRSPSFIHFRRPDPVPRAVPRIPEKKISLISFISAKKFLSSGGYALNASISLAGSKA